MKIELKINKSGEAIFRTAAIKAQKVERAFGKIARAAQPFFEGWRSSIPVSKYKKPHAKNYAKMRIEPNFEHNAFSIKFGIGQAKKIGHGWYLRLVESGHRWIIFRKGVTFIRTRVTRKRGKIFEEVSGRTVARYTFAGKENPWEKHVVATGYKEANPFTRRYFEKHQEALSKSVGVVIFNEFFPRENGR